MGIRVAESRTENYTKKQLESLGWNLKQPRYGGDVAEKQELRNYPDLKEKMGRELPEFVLFINNKHCAIIECKSTKELIDEACEEAKGYAKKSGLKIAIGVAGNEDIGVIVRNYYKANGNFELVTSQEKVLTQILSKKYLIRILETKSSDIEIELPDEKIFYKEADRIHKLLRNSDIPKARMATYLGTIILAFSQNKKILEYEEYKDLETLNSLAKRKIQDYNKPELIDIFKIPDPHSTVFNKLRNNLPLIINSLKRLNISALLQTGADVLGKFFEVFLKYSNDKKELGIVFTPRHIIDFMCQLVELEYNDKILDPCCGTGGFLVKAFSIMRKEIEEDKTLENTDKKKLIQKIKEEHIYGTESESDGIIYGLACLNMIFRGDGNTNIKHTDCFTKTYNFKFDKVLINPPYSQSKKGVNGIRETEFLDYCLNNLKIGGLLCAIIPYSIMCERSNWRKNIVKSNTIIASISVPAELFYPISSPAIIVLFKAGIPQEDKPIFYARIADDGYEIDRKKRSRVRDGDQKIIINEFKKWYAHYKLEIYENIDKPEFIITKSLEDIDIQLEIVPEAQLSKKKLSKELIEKEVDYVLREQLCFQLKYTAKLLENGFSKNKNSNPNYFLNSLKITENKDASIKKLSDFFKPFKSRGEIVYCEYGQKELHDKSWLKSGKDIIIAAGGFENGLYGFYYFKPHYQKPAITSPSSGSMCMAFVQEFPFSAYDNTIVLILKDDSIDIELLYYISALIRSEVWRYRYGRQITPSRLGNMEIDLTYYDKQSISKFREVLPFILFYNK